MGLPPRLPPRVREPGRAAAPRLRQPRPRVVLGSDRRARDAVTAIIQRGLALAAVALLAAVVALAATNVRDERAASTLPEPVGATYQAVAGPVAAAGRTTSCGGRVTESAA